MTTEPVFFPDAAAFRGWLQAHAATAGELLVGFHKVHTGQPSLRWSESVDEALCFGWIDGVRRRLDDDRYCIRFTPRQPGSTWSAVNVAKVQTLRAEGRMTPAGEAAFARRREERTAVYAYEQADEAALSDDERRRFADSAWAWFEAAPPGYRRVVLHWITQAKKPETRAARLQRLIEACGRGERLR